MSAKPAKRTRKRYSPVEIQAALTTLAYFGGNSERASEHTGVEASTLRTWRTGEHAELYIQIAERERPKLEAIATTQALEIMVRSAEAEHDLLSSLATVAADPSQSKTASEIAGALQKVTTSKGINTDKLFAWTGKPQQIIEHREGNEILRSLGAKIPGLVVESTATEIRETQRESRCLTTPMDAANAREAVSS